MPKPVRGSATRGRGRGRGKASASAESSAMANLLGDAANETSSQSTLDDSSMHIVPKITNPQHLRDESSPSPNSSPVSIPTETPAPTPARVPIPRSEPAVASASHAGGPSTRGGRGGARGTKPPTTSRFKPKNVRSDASKLDELRRKEEEKMHALAAEKAREQARLLRGRGRPARGRGDVMGRRGGGATGTFSIAPEALKSNPEFLSKSMSGGGGGGPGVKREAGGQSRPGYSGSGGGGGGGGSSDYNYAPRYPGEDDDAERINIESINLVSDDEASNGAPRASTYGKSRAISMEEGLRPVRLTRMEHKERVTVVNTETTTKPDPDHDDDELPTIDELRSAAPRGAFTPPKGTFIKHELDDDGDMEMSLRTGKSAPSASPDAKRKLQETIAAIPPLELGDTPDVSAEAIAKAKKDKKQREAAKKAVQKPVIQTAQDRAEYERHLHDVQVLADELGGLQGNLNGNGKDVSGDVQMDGTGEDEDMNEDVNAKSGRLYLFQFPPVLPQLYNPIHGKPKTPAEIEAEELATAEEKKKAAEATTKGSKGKGKATTSSDDQPAIKVEGEPVLTPEERKKKEDEEKRTKRQGFVKEEGYIGKLIVRESGRVELCWGGTNLIIGRGVDTRFLTTGVVVDSQERGPPGGGAPEGKAMSMGKIMGKFVVTPDWQKMA